MTMIAARRSSSAWWYVATVLVPSCLLLGGCAGLPGSQTEPTPLFRDKAMSVPNATDRLVIGRSTREDVQAALGNARVVRFDSGYEVWAYRGVAPGSVAPGVTEFVILFGADGVLKKSRVRAPSGP